MSRTFIAMIAVAAVGMPFIGYAAMQYAFGTAPETATSAFVSEVTATVRSVAPSATGGIGQPPTKRVVAAITISDTDDIKVAQAPAANDDIQQIIAEAAPDIVPAEGNISPMPQMPSEALKAQRGAADSNVIVASAAPAGDCLAIGDLIDRDGDFKRNAKAFGELCVKQAVFKENGVDWVIHTITRSDGKGGPLWAVPHDNEDAGFDSGIWALGTYGGTMVSVETGGNRENKGIDPNRNFTGNATACGKTSPVFTAAFMDHWRGGTPIVGLHSNTPKGNVSVNGTLPNTTPHKAPKPSPFIKAKSGEDTLVFVASLQPDGQDPVADGFVKALLDNGINVMREHVSASNNDCSFSNYAVLKGMPDYYNIEVVHGDAAAQRQMIEVIMKMGR